MIESGRLEWRKGISWTMFRRVVDCGKEAEFAIAERLGEPRAARETDWPTFYADAGTIVQKVMELYFNQGINLKPGGKNVEGFERAARRVLASEWCDREVFSKATYPSGKGLGDLKARVMEHIPSGVQALFEAGLLDKRVRSEVPSPATCRGLPIFAQVDFLVETDHGDLVYDGKINAATSADARQLVWTALTRTMAKSPRNVLGGGFVYWKHGYRRVDVSVEAQGAFLDGDFARALPIFERLRGPGLDEIPANPVAKKVCKFCSWNQSCRHSMVRRPPPDFGASEVSLDDMLEVEL